MIELLQSARTAVAQDNWPAALVVGLTLPDICASVESPDGTTTGKTYAAWWDQWVGPRYDLSAQRLAPLGNLDDATRATIFEALPNIGSEDLNGSDTWALRCALLHQGRTDTSTQKSRDALERFVFTAPIPGKLQMHLNRSNGQIQLQVDTFVNDVCDGVDAWLAANRTNAEFNEKVSALAIMTHPDAGGGFRV